MPLQRALFLTTGTAFVMLIALICGLTLNGLLQLQTLGSQIHTVVEHHNRKIDLITQTRLVNDIESMQEQVIDLLNAERSAGAHRAGQPAAVL